MDVPTFEEIDERLEQLHSSDRTIAEAVLYGSELNPLERFIYENEPAGKSDTKFRKELREMLNYVVGEDA